MKIILRIKIYSKESKESLVCQKEYESIDVPEKGSKIVDSIFAEEKMVTKVIHNYQERSVVVYLEDKEVKSTALEGHIQEVAELHGWTIEDATKYSEKK